MSTSKTIAKCVHGRIVRVPAPVKARKKTIKAKRTSAADEAELAAVASDGYQDNEARQRLHQEKKLRVVIDENGRAKYERRGR